MLPAWHLEPDKLSEITERHASNNLLIGLPTSKYFYFEVYFSRTVQKYFYFESILRAELHSPFVYRLKLHDTIGQSHRSIGTFECFQMRGFTNDLKLRLISSV